LDRTRQLWTQLRLTGASAGSTILRIRSGCAVPPVPLHHSWMSERHFLRLAVV